MPPVPFDADALADRIGMFIGHHVEGLPWNEALLLVLTALGCSAVESAAATGKSRRTVEHQLEAARRRVVPEQLEPTTLNAVAWARMHRTCCVASAWAAVCRSLPPEIDAAMIA